MSVQTAVDELVLKQLVEIYHAAFKPLELLSPARQSFTDDELLAQLRSEKVFKFIGLDENENPCALALLATDLTEVPWISPRYFAHHYPQWYDQGKIYYVNTAMVAPDQRQGGAWITALIGAFTRKTAADGALMAFDCCQVNVEGGGMPRGIDIVARRMFERVEWTDLDTQHYQALFMGEPK